MRRGVIDSISKGAPRKLEELGSRGSGGLITSMTAHKSATVLVIGPRVSRWNKIAGNPSHRGTRPREGFRPTRPVCEAGRRIDPPPSVPIAIGPIPAETAATAPPLEPPGVNSRFQGLRVGPKIRLSV